MKKALSLVLAVVLLCGCVFTLASCGAMLSGKYSAGLTTYEFSGNKFTHTTSIGNFSYTASGTYKITTEEEQQYITFTYTDGDEKAKEDDGIKMELTKGTENGVDYIKFGKGFASLVKYEKVK